MDIKQNRGLYKSLYCSCMRKKKGLKFNCAVEHLHLMKKILFKCHDKHMELTVRKHHRLKQAFKGNRFFLNKICVPLYWISTIMN